MYEVKSSRQMKLIQKWAESGFWHLSNKYILSCSRSWTQNSHIGRSKHLVNYLHANNISVGYTRILRIETQLAEAVLGHMELAEGV